ncbi:unnamed protein product [Staurois parvus]|uniref:Uncharacterized protein n=1 Tax=Staurois parvus TaxID=386267 RepID=A0ABN9H469_9NEOB|nr:unnamed protein product [Staurois parvus]
MCPCPNSKKPMKKVPGASHGAPTDPGPSAVPEFPNGQSAPGVGAYRRKVVTRGGLTTHGDPGQ